MLASHSDNFVNHVEAGLWYLRPRVLLTDHLAYLLILGVLGLQEGLVWRAAHFFRLFGLEVLAHKLIRFHVAIVVLLDHVVPLVRRKFGALRPT